MSRGRRNVFGVVLMTLAMLVLCPNIVMAAGAGGGYSPTGGSCRGGNVGDTWFDTCYGASWVYYKYDNPDRSSRGDIKMPGSNNISGATIPASICGRNYDGFWHLGLEVYRIAANAGDDSSVGRQAGTVKLGNLKAFGGGTRFVPDEAGDGVAATPTDNINGVTAGRYGNSVLSVGVEYNDFYRDIVQRGDVVAQALFEANRYSSDSPLGWFCGLNPDRPTGGSFASRSNVRIGNNPNDYETTNWVDRAAPANAFSKANVGSSVTVTFSHDMRYTGQLPNNDVEGGIQKAWTYDMTSSGVSLTKIEPNTENSPVFKPTVKDRVETVWQSHPYTFTMPNTNVTICEYVEYWDKTLENGEWVGGKSWSKACANISPGNPPPEVSVCADFFPGMRAGADYGETKTLSQVRNVSSPNTWKKQDDTLWAKPGDEIQFQHVVCTGANAVRTSWADGIIDHGNHGPYGGEFHGRDSFYHHGGGSATIRATSPDSAHIFGGNDHQRSQDVVRSFPANGKIGPSIVLDPSYTNSPYKCIAEAFPYPKRPNYLGMGYILPGFNRPLCSEALKTSNVGDTIKQEMDYTGTVSASSSARSDIYWLPCGEFPCPFTHSWYGGGRSTGALNTFAQVKIPFNYTLTPEATIDNPVAYPGNDISVTVDVTTNPRGNSEIPTGDYATMTKDSVYEIVVFTLDPSVPSTGTDSVRGANNNYPGGSGNRACTYYNHWNNCSTLKRVENEKFNGGGNLGEAVDNIFRGSLAVPDMIVGTKICVASGVWPSDSHNTPNGAASGAGEGDIALKQGGNSWSYSEPVCRTILKKPMVYFESSGVYTTGGIITSQSTKSPGSVLGNLDGLLSGSVTSGMRRVFGSWSEYETIAKGDISTSNGAGFGSGAVFGYDRNNGGSQTIASNVVDGKSALAVNHNDRPKPCVYSTQTITNDQCSREMIGRSDINAMGETILARLKARYLDPAATPYPSGTVINSARIGYTRIEGDATIGKSGICLNKGSATNNMTSIIHVTGRLTIEGNIRYGSGSRGDNCTEDTYADISQLPQQLIFARNIDIIDDVTTIDAWLIAGQADGGSEDGVINTCFNIAFEDLNADKCDKTLTVNGATFARKLILNRTAGADGGSRSIIPAEVFNLRQDAYMWGFVQAQRFSQAVTTYARELAPRY